MSSHSITSCSFRLLTTRIPKTLFLKTPSFFQPPTKKHTLFSFRPITFQKVPTTIPSSSSSSSPSSTTQNSTLQPIEELPPKLQEIVHLFQSVQEPKAKYEQLLFYGKNLKPLESQFKTNDNKVQGCVSQVWVRAYLDPHKNVVYEADSDSLLTKGLAALLVTGFSGRPVEDVIRVKPDFVQLLGLQQSLTPSRNNGFLNMLKLMQKKALMLYVEDERKGSGEFSSSEGSEVVKGGGFAENSSGGGGEIRESVSQSSDFGLKVEKGNDEFPSSSSEFKGSGGFAENSSGDGGGIRESVSQSSDFGLKVEKGIGEFSSSSSKVKGGENSKGSEVGGDGGELRGRGRRIKEKLEKELGAVELKVEDVSYQHAGHAGARGSGDGETHFNLRVVSQEFEGKSMVKRHRLIYKLLEDELQSGLHALSIEAKTPSEVSQR